MSNLQSSAVVVIKPKDDVDDDEISMSLKFAEDLKCAFSAFVFEEAKRKCAIFQSGQRRNIFHYPRRRSTQQTNVANILPKMDVACDDDDDDDDMPSEKVLNEIKLDRELECLIDIYNIAVESLRGKYVTEKWENLFNAIIKQRQNEGEVQKMEQILKENKLKLKELRLKLDTQTNLWLKRMKQQDEKINILRFNLRNVRQLNDLEYNLVQKWEENRYAQAKIVGENAERILQQQIANCKHLLKSENCRFEATQKYLGLQMENYKNNLAEWQQKFVCESARYDSINQSEEQKIYELKKLHQKQRNVYEQRVQYVEQYMAQKAEEQQLLMQEMRRIQSAVQIQAWWRGTMVRRGLGPYRKKSKKSKKGKTK